MGTNLLDNGTRDCSRETATLELTPEQSKVIAVAQQMADRLTLALRSVADAQEPDALVAKHLLSGDNNEGQIQIIKSGVIQKMTNTGTQQAQ